MRRAKRLPSKQTYQSFQLALPNCQTLQQIRDLVQDLDIDLSQRQACSRQILLQVLSYPNNFDQLQSFFSDPTLHTNGSFCFQTLLQWLAANPQAVDQLKKVHHCLRQSLELGLLQHAEIEGLLAELATIRVREPGTVSKLGDMATIQEWYLMIANAVKVCPVLSLRHLRQQDLQQLSLAVSTAPLAASSLVTLCLLQRYVVKEREGAFGEITKKLVMTWLFYQKDKLESQEQFNQIRDAGEVGIDGICSFLQDLKPAFASQALVGIAEAISGGLAQGDSQVRLLQIWNEVLSKISVSSTNRIMKQRRWRQTCDRSRKVDSLDQRKRICIRLWTAIRMAPQMPNAECPFWIRDAIQHLARQFQRELQPEQDMLEQMRLTFQSLPFPSCMTLVQQIAEVCPMRFGLQTQLQRVDSIQPTWSERCISVFDDDFQYYAAKRGLKTYLTQVAQQVNTEPEAFLHMARALILCDKLSVKLVTRLLESNIAFNLTLSHVMADTQRRKDTARWTKRRKNALTPELALHILTSIARASAISLALSSRQSYRKVYYIYLHIHKYTGGCDVGYRDVVRALWYAGVMRLSRHGTSRVKVNWIYRKIAQVEGADVADQLLWFGPQSEGLQGTGWEEWTEVSVAKELKEEEKKERRRRQQQQQQQQL